jgi:aspartate/methionine/tyrosine aminotransferase
MSQLPISNNIIQKNIQANGISNIGTASIRQIVKVVRDIEAETGIQFVKMEMGVPGLMPSNIGVEAEIKALESGVASIYPMIEGLPELKNEMSKFVKLFLDVTVSPESCIPTVGSMQGGFAAFLTACRRDTKKNKTLFIDPGFPVQKQQMKILGLAYDSFDVYNYRGNALKEKLESYCQTGTISTIIYSSPNNPSWICFTEEELQIIGEIANKYDIIVIEDLAYFGMDFRKDYSVPGSAPFQPTVAKYTENYILLISSSKAFSYAGQRIASLVISDSLFTRKFPDLETYFSNIEFGRALIYGAVYALSSGTAHSTQYALTALLKAANDGSYNFIGDVKEYGKRAKIMKELFIANDFNIVYDTDLDEPIADGFYFTISYPGLTGSELLQELMFYGISAITLDITGSEKTEGLRACTSQIGPQQLQLLQERLQLFNANH